MIMIVERTVILSVRTRRSIFYSDVNISCLFQVSTNGEISLVAGAPSGCDCNNDANCDCYSGDDGYAKDARVNAPSSLAVSPDGELFVADLGNIRIRSVRRNKPYLNPLSMYEVSSPISDELYLFDSNGSHIYTQSLTTGDDIYNLTYSGEGDLASITDQNNNIVTIRCPAFIYSCICFVATLVCYFTN